MKVRTRSQLILVVTIILFLIVMGYISQSIILESFRNLEETEMTGHVQSVISSLNRQEENLASICREWAFQPEIADIVNGNTSQPASLMFEHFSLEGYGIDDILFYNSSGDLSLAIKDGNQAGFEDPDIRALDTVVKESIIPQGFQIGIGGRYGISSIAGIPVILTGYPITPIDQPDHPVGTLILVQTLNTERLQDLEIILQIPTISLQSYPPPLYENLTPEERIRITKGGIVTREVDANHFEGLTAITGIENNPTLLLLEVETERPVYQQVQRSLVIFGLSFVIFAMIFLITVQFLLQRYILGPISDLDARMVQIGADPGIIRRVDEFGDYEILSLKRSLNRMLDEIRQSEEQLRSSLQEKTVLLREIHHRVKNNLQIIISLLNLQARYIHDERALAVIQESQNRIKAMSLVHEKLYRTENISQIKLNDYVRSLAAGLFRFFGIRDANIRLSLRIDDDIYVDINAAISLGLIINELVSNSIKYAFPDNRAGEISIFINRENNKIMIIFQDDGTGIPPDIDWRNANSLGLQLVISLVDQLNGEIDLDRRVGTKFTMVIPIE